MKNFIFLSFIVSIIFLGSCKPDTPEPVQTYGSLQINFENRLADKTLVLADQSGINAANNHYQIDKLLYYVSNVSLGGCNCEQSSFDETESYHLVRYFDDPNEGGIVNEHTIKIDNVRTGTYKNLDFSIGVDPVRNTSGAQVGALDPIYSMLWSWISGYIFYKVEGKYVDTDGKEQGFIFHLGGDGAYREISLDATNDIKIEDGQVTEITIIADHNGTFGAKNTIDFNLLNSTMSSGDNANKMADNYATIFSIKGN